MSFYVAGPPAEPSHYLISRAVTFQGVPATRILDLYGPHDQSETLQDLVTLAIKDAALRGSTQVTILLTHPNWNYLFRSLGFILSSPSRFCWHPLDHPFAGALNGLTYWTLGDSDNDAPE